jgi:hypothetical protein
MRWMALAGAAMLTAACSALADEKTACDGLVYTEAGLTRAQYLPCAAEIMDSLDRLSPQVDAMVAGSEAARSEATLTLSRLGRLLSKAGGHRNMLERWSDRPLNDLNLSIWNTYSHHQACLMVSRGLFSSGPLAEKSRSAATSECRAYRRPYESAKREYRYLR